MPHQDPLVDATIVMVGVIFLQVVLLFVQLLFLKKQSDANQLSAHLQIFQYHHSDKMREMRKEVSSKLKSLLDKNIPLDEQGEEAKRLKQKTEDILNYYEFLGSLLRYKLVDDRIIDMVHNSAIRIWKIVETRLDLIRPKQTRGPDYASDFSYLVDRCLEYRKKKKFGWKLKNHGTKGTENTNN